MADELERTATRERSRPPEEQSVYEQWVSRLQAMRDRADNGRIVIRRQDVVWQQNRQGYAGHYCGFNVEDTALRDWDIFMHDIFTHSGTHTHQGGLVIYALQGKGRTVVNGEDEPWEEGDLLLLPVVPGGCEHQHFNDEDTEFARWIAFVYEPFRIATGAAFEQVSESPDWKGSTVREDRR